MKENVPIWLFPPLIVAGTLNSVGKGGKKSARLQDSFGGPLFCQTQSAGSQTHIGHAV